MTSAPARWIAPGPVVFGHARPGTPSQAWVPVVGSPQQSGEQVVSTVQPPPDEPLTSVSRSGSAPASNDSTASWSRLILVFDMVISGFRGWWTVRIWVFLKTLIERRWDHNRTVRRHHERRPRRDVSRRGRDFGGPMPLSSGDESRRLFAAERGRALLVEGGDPFADVRRAEEAHLGGALGLQHLAQVGVGRTVERALGGGEGERGLGGQLGGEV